MPDAERGLRLLPRLRARPRRAPGRFATADGGEQLRLEPAPRRRAARARDRRRRRRRPRRASPPRSRRLGVARRARRARAARAVEPATGVRVELVVEPRLAQKPAPPLATNAPGRSVARRRALAGRAAGPPVAAAQARPRRARLARRRGLAALLRRRARLPGERRGARDRRRLPALLDATTTTCSCSPRPVAVPAPHRVGGGRRRRRRPRGRGDARRATRARHVWGLGRHDIGSNYFWYLRDPAGNFAEYSSDLDVIADDEAWQVAASTAAHPLAAWGPPVPPSFLAPDDIAALARGERRDAETRATSRSSATARSGQLLAILLGQRGWRVRVLERWPEPYPLPRAVHFDHEVARVLQARGRRRRRSRATPSRRPSTSGATPPASCCSASGATRGAALSGWPESTMFCQPELERDPRRARARELPSVRVAARRRGGRRAQRRTGVARSTRAARGRRARTGARALRRRLRRRQQLRARRARRAAGRDLGFHFDWLVVDVIPHEPRRWDPLNWQLCDPARPDDARLRRAGPAPLGVHAAPARDARGARTARTPRGACSRRGTCARTTRRSSATRSTRFRARWADAGAAAGCCSPATPRT